MPTFNSEVSGSPSLNPSAQEAIDSDNAVSTADMASPKASASTSLNSSAQEVIKQWITQMESSPLSEKANLASNIKNLAGEFWPSELKRICNALNSTAAEVEAYITLSRVPLLLNDESSPQANVVTIAERISTAESLKPKGTPLESLLKELNIDKLLSQGDAWERGLLWWVIENSSITNGKQKLLNACRNRETSRHVTTRFVKTVKSRLVKKNMKEEDIDKLASFIEKASARRRPTKETVLSRAEKEMKALLACGCPIPENIKALATQICQQG